GAERKRVKTFATISEQTGLAAVANAEMIVRQPGGYTPAGGAVQKPNLHKKRFVDFFQRLRLFRQRGGQRAEPNRSTVIFLDNRQQKPPVNLIKPVLVHFQQL